MLVVQTGVAWQSIQSSVNSTSRTQARSMVITRQGIVATSQTLASQAGAQVLARGGTAVDAAIAANAVLGVVEPMSNGIGGDLFALYYDAKTGVLTGLNASGWAPKGLSIEFLKSKGLSNMPQEGIHTVTVPGCVEGWAKLHSRFGRLPWAELFRPAIYYANNGFPVTELIRENWRLSITKLSLDVVAAPIFLPDGAVPAVGQVFRNPELGRALELIASAGPQAFYKGDIAKMILTISEVNGGAMTAADLAEFQAEWVAPISTEYRGWKVYELPPNGQGIAALEMLNILERFPLPEMKPDSADAFHLKIEAQKLAYQDLARYVADPRFASVPVSGLLSKSYAAGRAALIQPAKANCGVQPGRPPASGTDTVYLTVVDRDGNIVSLIQSIYLSFGSGIAVPRYGFHLHNRGAMFSFDPAHPNALAPRKRPFHTIIPAFMEKGNLKMGFGIMGGLNQAQAHAQFVSNIVDHGMNIQAALEAARFTKLTFGGCDVLLENRLPAETLSALRARGHVLDVRIGFDDIMGGGQAVLRDVSTGVNYGASSPRKDGAAIPEPDPYFEPLPRVPAPVKRAVPQKQR
ncbi:MAG: gamma-glutamyltransferase [Bryobacteraceae bacterium]|nr:gamma-glutamyltransferase [Bryobacteraceae bacterium]